MQNATAVPAVKWTGLCALIVGCALIMGQGCPPPAPPPSDGGGGGGTDTGGDKAFLGAANRPGVISCQTCHSQHYADWSMTNHAHALQTLKNIGQDKNPECLECHTVGFGLTDGYVDEATTPHLANVQCESCHGPAGPHVRNVDNEALRPSTSINSAVCGKCHTDAHHPTYDEWQESGHGKVTADVGHYFETGARLTSCGVCHSGDYRDRTFVRGETLADNALQGVPVAEQNGATCVICHNPHKNTGNAAAVADPTEDFQLRYPEVADPAPSNLLADAQNSARFNLCGQCHRSRDATWTGTSRPSHHSIQSNFYTGEMPVPDGTAALVVNQRSVHRFVPKQCVSCHMPTAEFESDEVPADSGHRFVVGFTNCSGSGCHASTADASAILQTLQAEIQAGLANIKTRLDAGGGPATWEYSSSGGPASQKGIPDAIKQVRFEYYYVLNDGSLGVHNPGYARAIIADAKARLTQAGK